MNVLLVGSGGREHALAWKIAQSPRLSRLVIAPGSDGMSAPRAPLGERRRVAAADVEGLVALAVEVAADLVVVGPEAALAAGLADRLAGRGIACFGPTAAAARIESSKAWMKALAARAGLPTARHAVFTDAASARAGLDGFAPPYVVKADGLAAGKGVAIAADRAEAEAAIDAMLAGRFGDAGARVVVEEHMAGEEASLFALCDGETVLPFGGAQDHKRAHDGDRGPNTGGMGSYAPAAVLTPEVEARAMAEIVAPAAAALAAEGAPYRGVLFAGLMIADGAPRLIEFNARFGDPECQVLMLRLADDLLPYLHAAATGGLAALPPPVWRDEAAVCVVLAARGYPDAPQTGGVITGADADFGPDVVVFHAGAARREDGALVSAGGRVLNVCARAPTVTQARDRAYAAVDRIGFPGGFHRRDIAWRAPG